MSAGDWFLFFTFGVPILIWGAMVVVGLIAFVVSVTVTTVRGWVSR